MISACATTNHAQTDRIHNTFGSSKLVPGLFDHVISIEPDGKIGNPLRLVEKHLADGKDKGIEDQVQHTVAAINRELDTLNQIVIFIHGGLVDEISLIARVNSVLKNNQIPDKVFPIFVNWQAGLFDTYTHQLSNIDGERESDFGFLKPPVYFLTDLVDVVVHAPRSWLISGTHAYNSTRRKISSIDDSLKLYENEYDFVHVVQNGALPNNLLNSAAWWSVSWAKLFATPVTHTIGKPAWDEMLRRASNVVYPSDGKNGLLTQETINHGSAQSPESGGVILELMRQINHLKEASGKQDLKVNLVGHSMGAIIANRMLRDNPKHEFDNVVHMASADSIDSTVSSVVPFLRENSKAEFYSMLLHPRNEDAERNAFGAAPSGSLLVYIDDMFTSPDSFLSRRAGRWDNMASALGRLPIENDVQSRINFTVFGVDNDALRENKTNTKDRVKHPQKHGDFSRLAFWDTDVWTGQHLRK